MRRFESILYVSRGGDDETSSLKQALSLARNDSATLQVLALGPQLSGKYAEYAASYESSISDRARTSIAAAMAEIGLQADEVRVSIAVELGETPAIRVVQRVLRNAHDLLVKQAEPAEGGSGFRAFDMQLLRSCPCPVWLSRPIVHSRNEIRVGVAVDAQSEAPAGHDLALKLLQIARSLADTCSGELDVVSCWDFEFENFLRHSPWARLPEEKILASVVAAERISRAALDELVRESAIGGKRRIHHVRGRPEDIIPQLVGDLELDILVMGTVARAGIPGFVIGNTAENTLRAIRCSLLAVKPNGFVSPVRAY